MEEIKVNKEARIHRVRVAVNKIVRIIKDCANQGYEETSIEIDNELSDEILNTLKKETNIKVHEKGFHKLNDKIAKVDFYWR